MPSNKWVLIAIGVALGMFVIPMAMGYIGSLGGGGGTAKGQ